MNDDEIRRIRGLVVADPQLPPLPLPVDPRQAERFHRALGAVRRVSSVADATADAPAIPAAPPPPPEPAPVHRHEGAPTSTASTLAPVSRERTERHERHERRDGTASSSASRRKEPLRDGAPADGLRPRPPVIAVAEAGARETQEAEAEQEAALPDQTVTAPPMPIPHVAWTPLPEGWERELADTVATLCRSSEPSFHSWTIQVPVDAETLPHTELRLTFSPHQLLLRFSTQSTRSLALISAHQSQLRALLVRALPGDRHIEIDIT